MINLSIAATEQIRLSVSQDKQPSSPLRIAIKKLDDGSFHYAMGFDDQRLPGDTFVNIEDIHLVVSELSKPLAEGMTVDFVELEPGKSDFIFLNPNDPAYIPPKSK